MRMPGELPLEPRLVVWPCEHCHQEIKFDAVQLADRIICRAPCPHCGRETTLQEPPPWFVLDVGWVLPGEAGEPLAPAMELPSTPPSIVQAAVPPPPPGTESPAPAVSGPPPPPPPTSLPLPSLPPDEYLPPWLTETAPEPSAPLASLGLESLMAPIMVTLPPDPPPPPPPPTVVDVRWLTDLGVVYFRQHQFGEAFLCFSRAAKQDFATAQFCLAVCHFNGHGTVQDEAAALPWLQKAAAQGDANAEFTLSLAYRLGRGVAPDAEQAGRWLKLAAAHGHPEAIQRSRELNDQPTPKEQPMKDQVPKRQPEPLPPSVILITEATPAKPRQLLQGLILELFRKKP